MGGLEVPKVMYLKNFLKQLYFLEYFNKKQGK